MQKFFVLLLLALLTPALHAQLLDGAAAAQYLPGAEQVWLKPQLRVPAYLRLAPGAEVPEAQFELWFRENFQLFGSGYGWSLIRSDEDALGHRHNRYRQSWQGIPVANSMLIVHSYRGMVYAFNGEFYPMPAVNVSPLWNEEQALQAALREVDAESYMWETNALHLTYDKAALRETSEGFVPRGELVMAAREGDMRSGDFRLAWHFDIYAAQPHGRWEMFIDAENGQLIDRIESIHTIDTPGVAVTRYSGNRGIVTDYTGANFRLYEQGRGAEIWTRDVLNGTEFGNAVEFFDNDNFWNNRNARHNDAAGDCHWASEMTYDYFLQRHGRNSLDNNGHELHSYMHFSNQFFNAFWNGSFATFGDGNSNPLSTIDITAHEFVHGLTNFSADLVYRNEPGALNESFSDIFGKAVEQYARPNDFSWGIGDDIGAFRDMANPRRFGNPRNYQGANWATGSFDNGGVHINSGVQNHWFYLLVQGGSGSNDFNDPYTIPAIGWDTASAIAFRNLTVYLTPNSEYAEARFFAIQSAIDLYGRCGRIHEVVANAWYAVGVGSPFSINPIVDFGASSRNLCSYPYQVSFLDRSVSAVSWRWDFGDGNSSTQTAPQHVYAQPGVYTVKLTVNGVCGGTDSLVQQAFITVRSAPAAPHVAALPPLNCQDQALLSAASVHPVLWYNSNGDFIGQGDTLLTPPLSEKTSFLAVATETPASQFVGRADNLGATGGFITNDTRHMLFDVAEDLVLKSVKVYAQGAGQRIIEYRSATGVVLAQRSVFVPNGESRITLNIPLKAGTGQQLGLKGVVDLFANNTNLNFPYQIAGLISITGSNHTQPQGLYLYFYDWEIHSPGCAGIPATVEVQVGAIEAPQLQDQRICVGEAATFAAGLADSTVYWYDALGNWLGEGTSFTTTALNDSAEFLARNLRWGARLQAGPLSKNFGRVGYLNNSFDTHLSFSVLQPLRLRSVAVDAQNAGWRSLELRDGAGQLLDTFSVYLPAGDSRVLLNLDLEPGSYRLGGLNLDLAFTSSNVAFPYELPGLLSITGGSAGLSNYYYFYDWEIQAQACFSDPVRVWARLLPGPGAAFSYQLSGAVASFSDVSAAASSWLWDFGDGQSSTMQNPVHQYASAGNYTVRLTVTAGTCSETTEQTVVISPASGMDNALAGLRLFPNPGAGRFTLSGLERPAQLNIYDALGRMVWQGIQPAGTAMVDWTPGRSGAYRVQVLVPGGIRSFTYIALPQY